MWLEHKSHRTAANGISLEFHRAQTAIGALFHQAAAEFFETDALPCWLHRTILVNAIDLSYLLAANGVLQVVPLRRGCLGTFGPRVYDLGRALYMNDGIDGSSAW
jgi:hypothetical protein